MDGLMNPLQLYAHSRGPGDAMAKAALYSLACAEVRLFLIGSPRRSAPFSLVGLEMGGA